MGIKHSSGVVSCSWVAVPSGGAYAGERIARPRHDAFMTLDPTQRPSAPRRWDP